MRSWSLHRVAARVTLVIGLLGAGLSLLSAGDAARAETDHPIEVFFSRHPESDGDFAAVFPLARTAPDAGVATAALRALIAGPTPAETASGYFSEIGQMLHGPSNCRGEDFSLRLQDGLATVRFCREVASAGIGQDARAQSTIVATLRQFPTIQRVRLLDQDGDCLFDLSGENPCPLRQD
jgi:spore germination protein GerM